MIVQLLLYTLSLVSLIVGAAVITAFLLDKFLGRF